MSTAVCAQSVSHKSWANVLECKVSVNLQKSVVFSCWIVQGGVKVAANCALTIKINLH